VRAIVIDEHGGPEVLRPADLPRPAPAAGEALVRVKAVSVNGFLDIANRRGQVAFARYSFPHVLGSEHAGEIAAFGPDAHADLEIGDQVVVSNRIACGDCANCRAGREEACLDLGVIGVTTPGAYAEFTVVPVENLRPLPDGMSHVEAAAIIVNGPLAQHQLDLADAKRDEWVLIQAAASASGSMALRAAQHRGCRVIATSRQDWKRERLAGLGADAVVDPTQDDFAAAVMHVTGGSGADVAVINIGDARLWEQTVEAVGNRGRIVTSGAMFGGRAEFNARTFYERNQTIIGVRTANRQSTERCWMQVGAGLRPIVDKTFPLEHVADAHKRVEMGMNVGRVVVTVD
jgi:NADPH:quinone reductase-like Zn-dependent oxidoreductase